MDGRMDGWTWVAMLDKKTVISFRRARERRDVARREEYDKVVERTKYYPVTYEYIYNSVYYMYRPGGLVVTLEC